MSQACVCSDCGSVCEWRMVDEEYERGGVRVQLRGLPAMVCPRCGAVSYDPDTTESILEAANAMFKIAGSRSKAVLATASV